MSDSWFTDQIEPDQDPEFGCHPDQADSLQSYLKAECPRKKPPAPSPKASYPPTILMNTGTDSRIFSRMLSQNSLQPIYIPYSTYSELSKTSRTRASPSSPHHGRPSTKTLAGKASQASAASGPSITGQIISTPTSDLPSSP